MRNQEYEGSLNSKAKQNNQRLYKRRGADSYNLEVHNGSSNAAFASVAIASNKFEHLGAFLSIYAQNNNLNVPTPSFQMPKIYAPPQLALDPALSISESKDPEEITVI